MSLTMHGGSNERDRRQIVPLTGVRGVACVWVLLYHANLLLADSHIFTRAPLLERGYLGVDLFFVLSGFVLAMTYGASFMSMHSSAIYRFSTGRAFRILPLHWVVLIAFAGLAPFITNGWLVKAEHSSANWIASFFLVQTLMGLGQTWNTPSWSLSAEWLAYLAFPILAFTIWQTRNIKILLILYVSSIATLTSIGLFRHGNLEYKDTSLFGLVRCFTEFFSGMLIYKACEIMPHIRNFGCKCFTIGIIGIAITIILPRIDVFAPIAFGLIVFACWLRAAVTELAFGNAFVAWLGKISFSLYLVHWFMIEGAFAILPEARRGGSMALVAVVMALGLAVPVAALLYRVVEEPSHKLGRAYLARRRTSVVTP